MSTNPRFCEDCSCVPDGVIAEVEMIALPTKQEFSEYRVAREAPEIIDAYVGHTARLIVRAVESTNPRVEIGNEARFVVEREGRSAEQISEAIVSCPGPKRSRVDRLLGRKGICQAVTITLWMPI